MNPAARISTPPQNFPAVAHAGTGSTRDTVSTSSASLNANTELTKLPFPKGNLMRSKLFPKFSISDAKNETLRNPEYDTELECIIDLPENLLNFANVELKYVETSLVEGSEEERKISKSHGTVSFANFYSNDVWVMEYNYKDKNLASFYMSDIVKLQKKCAGVTENFKILIRKNLNLEESKDFFIKNKFENEDVLSDEQLKKFMETTPNGKSSARIFSEYGKIPVMGTVLKEGDNVTPVYSLVIAVKNIK